MFVDLSPLAASVDVIDKQNVPTERHPLAFTPSSCSLGLDLSQHSEAIEVVPVSYAFPAAPVPMMAQPNVGGKKAVKFAEPIVERSTDDISSPLHESDFNMDEDVDTCKKKQAEATSSSCAAQSPPSEDVHSSATPGSVQQARVVQPPCADDVDPPIKATKQQQAFYDIIRRFGNARSDGKRMDAIKERIWEGNYSHREVRKAFAQHGDMKLTLKKFVMFTMFQELTPDGPVDKGGHYYTVCINLKKQRFDVLDSLRSGDDESLRSHAEFFIENLKQTWLRHYEGSKVQISDFPIEIKTAKQGTTCDCGIYLLEYLAKWEGRKVPTLNKETASELRKIYLWNWVTNVDFNKRAGAKDWVEGAAKNAVKRYR